MGYIAKNWVYTFEKYPDKNWCWHNIYNDENIMKFIKKCPNKPWDWSIISGNYYLVIDWVDKYPNKPWDWGKISKNYVSSFYVNNKKTNFETYSQLVKTAIDIHNQNDHQDLLDKSLHIKYLDAFADNALLLKQIDSAYIDWQKMKKELTDG